MAQKILVNALHTQTGGGLVYLNRILPYLASEKDFEIILLCQEVYKERLNIPENVKVEAVNIPCSFAYVHFWEQCVLPFKARKMGAKLTFNIANYAPIFAPKPVVFMTNNPEVRHYAPLKWQVYWHVLIWLTRLSVWVSPLSLSNGEYLKKVYLGGIFKPLQKKIRSTPAACDYSGGKAKKRQEHQLFTVGDFYAQKDYPTLIYMVDELKKRFKNIELIIVGRFVHADVEAEVKSTIAKLRLEDNITLKGAVPHDEVLDLYAKSTVYVSASDAETYPLTLLEALKTGTPAVVKDYAFNREVAGDDAALYAPVSKGCKENGKAFAAKVTALLEDASTYKALQKAAEEKAANSSWEATASAVIKALKEVLS